MVPPQPIEVQEIREAAPPTKEGENPGVREQEMAREPNPVKRFLKVLGPGLITGASDDDPSGIGTYSAAGASLGYSIQRSVSMAVIWRCWSPFSVPPSLPTSSSDSPARRWRRRWPSAKGG